MRGWRIGLLLVVVWAANALMQSDPTLAAPVPSMTELEELLKKEPFSEQSWKGGWRERLNSWQNEPLEKVHPAYMAAGTFLKTWNDGIKNKLKNPLNKDGLAHMLIGYAILNDPSAERGIKARAGAAEAPLRDAVKHDRNNARAHALLAKVLMAQELPDPPYPRQAPATGKLKDALKHQAEARKLNAQPLVVTPREEALAAFYVNDLKKAAPLLLDQSKQDPTNPQMAELAAEAVCHNRDERGRRAALLKPLVDSQQSNGTLVSLYGFALALDDNKAAAVKEFTRARSLGVEPRDLPSIGNKEVTSIEKEVKEAEAAAAKRKKEEEDRQRREKEDEARRKEQARRQQEYYDSVGAFPRFLVWFGWGCVYFAIFYLGVMLLMAVCGLILARYTRGPRSLDLIGKAENELVATGQVVKTRHETFLTRIYIISMALALILFYLAIPFVIWGLLIVTFLLLLLGFFMRRDYQSAQMHTDLMKASGGGLWAVFRALFASFGKGAFGIKKGEDDCPRLFEALREVARRVNTEPVDEVWIAPGATIGVFQEGRGPFGIFGTRRRVLILGLATLHFLTISELKSILAHEYAHFSHADTYWSRFIYQVTLSIEKAMQGMASTGGWVTYVNPFYWFFFLYHKAYSLLSSGFSRSREFLADRMACSLYGSDVFSSALTKVCTDGTLFEQTIYYNIKLQMKKGKAYVNMYLAFRRYRDEQLTSPEREKLYKKLLDDKESVFDSHPTFAERVEAAEHLPAAPAQKSPAALHLFEKPDEIEKELTDFLTEVMHIVLKRK
jgi:Zn-dependent protease with chaperone function